MGSGTVLIQPGTGDVQAHIQRSGVGYVEIDWATHDGAGNPCIPSPSQATTIGVALPAGGGALRVAVSDPMSRWSTIAPCYGRLSVSPFQSWPAPEPSPTPNPLSSLAVHIEAPSSVAAGSFFTIPLALKTWARRPSFSPPDARSTVNGPRTVLQPSPKTFTSLTAVPWRPSSPARLSASRWKFRSHVGQQPASTPSYGPSSGPSTSRCLPVGSY
jgi:hypothetical protein